MSLHQGDLLSWVISITFKFINSFQKLINYMSNFKMNQALLRQQYRKAFRRNQNINIEEKKKLKTE